MATAAINDPTRYPPAILLQRPNGDIVPVTTPPAPTTGQIWPRGAG